MHGRIVRELGLRILSGDLAPGDRLPAESELIVKYEVSRPVLREAVRVLVAKGLVLSRQRAGAIVRPRNEWHLLDPDVLYWMIQTRPAPEFVQTLMGMRRVFEPGAAALAAHGRHRRAARRHRPGLRRHGRRQPTPTRCWSPTSRSTAASPRRPATT